MYRPIIFVIIVGFLALCTACKKSDLIPGHFDSVFAAHDVPPAAGTLVIKRLSDDHVWINNPARADIRYIPASTSKIPHTLIALETKSAMPETLFKWDGRERNFKMWNQDQTFTQAYQRSAVWVYQEITQSLGPEVMSDWLKRFDYGNHNIGTADDVASYWLRGPLETSAQEQVDFLSRLATRKLPISAATYTASRPMFVNEIQAGYTLYAKTGWMFDETAMDIGWFVGWVKTDIKDEIYVFALNIDMPDQMDTKKRKPLVMDALKNVGAWPG